MTRIIEHQIGDLERCGGFAPRAAIERPQPRQEDVEGEGLHEVVVGPSVEAGHNVVVRASRGEHQHGRLPGLGAQLAHELNATESGQHHIEDQDIEAVRTGGREPGGPGRRFIDNVSVFRQAASQQGPHPPIVFDEQNSHGLILAGRHAIVTAPVRDSDILQICMVQCRRVMSWVSREPTGLGRVTTWAMRLALVATMPAGLAAQTAASDTLTFEAALTRALAANPAVSAARLRGAVDRANIAVARERPNPEARVEVERETPTNSYSLALPLELGGQRSRRIAVGEAAALTGEAELARVMADVRASVRRAYLGRVVAEARLALFDDLRGVAARVRDVADQRFNVGDVPRLEVVQAQLALAQADNDLTAARAEARVAAMRLNALLGLPASTLNTVSSPVDPAVFPVPGDAVARAVQSGTEIAVLDRRMEEARARILLARALQAPDVTTEGTITRGAEPEFSTGWRAAVAVTLPLFTRHRAAVVVEEATLAHVTAERDAARARVEGEVAAAAALVDAERQEYVQYRDAILPQAIELERLADDAYRLGRTGIGAYLQALQATRDARLRALQVTGDFHTALADLGTSHGNTSPMTRSAGVSILVLVVAAVTACGSTAPEEVETETVVPVVTRVVEVGTIRGVVRATGTVTPAPGADLTIVAPEPTRILECPKPRATASRAATCSCVSKSRPLRRTRPRVARKSRKRKQACAMRRRLRARAHDLFDRGVAARKEMEDADRDQAEAEARLAEAQSANEASQVLGRRTTVIAPFNGVVAKRFHNPGDVVEAAASDPILRVIDVTRLEIVASVPVSGPRQSRDWRERACRCVCAGPPRPVCACSPARPSSSPAVRLGQVRLAFTASTALTAGTPVEIEIDAEQHKGVLLVPAAAIVREGAETAVFVAAGDKAHRTPVDARPGRRHARRDRSGLKAGEQVIVSGQARAAGRRRDRKWARPRNELRGAAPSGTRAPSVLADRWRCVGRRAFSRRSSLPSSIYPPLAVPAHRRHRARAARCRRSR